MVVSARDHAADEIEVCAWLDWDDTEVYPADLGVVYGRGERPYVDGSLCTSTLWNDAWSLATGDIAMMAADDILFSTRHWDRRIEEEFAKVPDGILMVYPDDGTPRKAPVNPCVSRRWIDLVGFTPAGWQGWYADEWIWAMAAELGRVVFLRDVRVLHVRRSHADQTYRDGEKARKLVGDWPKMRERFYSWEMVSERDALIRKLRAAIDDGVEVSSPDPFPPWMAESLQLDHLARVS